MVVGVGGCTEAEQVPAGVVTEQRLAAVDWLPTLTGRTAMDRRRSERDGLFKL